MEIHDAQVVLAGSESHRPGGPWITSSSDLSRLHRLLVRVGAPLPSGEEGSLRAEIGSIFACKQGRRDHCLRVLVP